MNPNNPLQKSLEESYFEGGKDYQYGGYVPPVVIIGEITPTPTPSITPTKTPTQTPTSSLGITPTPTISPTGTPTMTPTRTSTPTPTSTPAYDLYEAENCCSPFDTITIGLLSGTIYNQDAGVEYGGSKYFIIGNGSGIPVVLSSTTIDNICSTISCPSPTPTPTSSITPTPTISPGTTQTPTPSITPTISPTPSITLTNTPTISVSPTQTPSGTPTQTPTTTITLTPTITPTISVSPTRTITPTPTITPTKTGTPTPTPTRTPTPTPVCYSACRRYEIFNESYTLTGVYSYRACIGVQYPNKTIAPRATQRVCADVFSGVGYVPNTAQSFVKISLYTGAGVPPGCC